MPGGDGTGPMGRGPMTGRAAGYCAGYSVPGYMNPVPGRFWYRGGYRRAHWWGGWWNPYTAGAFSRELTAEEEVEALAREQDYLKTRLEEITKHIETMKKAGEKDKKK
jgi:hypothetical protein